VKAKWQQIKATPRKNPPGRYTHVSTPKAHVTRKQRAQLGVVTGMQALSTDERSNKAAKRAAKRAKVRGWKAERKAAQP
jgi:hypothetical protein